MNSHRFYLGIDIAKDTFACSLLTTPGAPVVAMAEYDNNLKGFEKFESWLTEHDVSPGNSIICLEATGVYGEHLCYWLAAKNYQVAVEPPLKVKRAFKIKEHKNDKVDSRQIAEYAFRFKDQLHQWNPKNDLIEQIRVLLTTREQLVQQKTAMLNALQALNHKYVQTPLANKIYETSIAMLKKHIDQIEKELKKLIDQHPDFKRTVRNLSSIPGVGMLMAVNFLVATDGFQNDLAMNYRKAAAFIGICPYEYSSGSSVYKKPRSHKYGPRRLRKLLHLAARSVVTHKKQFQTYYSRKEAMGKPKRLILNNVENKIVRLMCAIIRTGIPYVDNYISLHPKMMSDTP